MFDAAEAFQCALELYLLDCALHHLTTVASWSVLGRTVVAIALLGDAEKGVGPAKGASDLRRVNVAQRERLDSWVSSLLD